MTHSEDELIKRLRRSSFNELTAKISKFSCNYWNNYVTGSGIDIGTTYYAKIDEIIEDSGWSLNEYRNELNRLRAEDAVQSKLDTK